MSCVINCKFDGSSRRRASLNQGGLFSGIGSLFGFADSGHVSGPGTSTSDSIPAMLSNGEFVVNAKATKKNRTALEAINSGRVPAFAKGGLVGGSFANSNSYAPVINMSSNGLPGGNAMASEIAKAVGKALDHAKPDTFGRTDSQRMMEASFAMQRVAKWNG